MAWPKESAAAFSGASGQAAVVAELLQRKCNAAIPLVDIGTDVFAFKDDREEVARIQVKTDTAKPYKDGKGYHARFSIPLKQLSHSDNPKLFYALAVRFHNQWANYIVIGRVELESLRYKGCGSRESENLILRIAFHLDNNEKPEVANAQCGEFDFTAYLNAWHRLPPLKMPAQFEPGHPQA